jgi:hypothetical protein
MLFDPDAIERSHFNALSGGEHDPIRQFSGHNNDKEESKLLG